MSKSSKYKYDFFISYTHENKTFVEPFVKQLKEEGFSVWFDNDELKLGDSIRRKIKAGMRNSHYVLLIISKEYHEKFMNKNLSFWLNKEQINADIGHEIRGYNPLIWLNLGLSKIQKEEINLEIVDILGIDRSKNFEINSIIEVINSMSKKLFEEG